MDRITYDMLKEVGACSSKLESFAAVFPAGAPISMESVYRAIEGGLDLRFAARLVPDGERAIFDETVTIMEGVYDMAIAPACQRRNEMTGPAWEAYKRIVAVRGDIALARVERDTAIDEPTRRCHEVMAAAFRVYLAGFGLALVVALTRGVSDGKEE